MDKRIKDQWVNDLRSGNYTQGFGSLVGKCNGNTAYCCLGVLAYVSEPSLSDFDTNDIETYVYYNIRNVTGVENSVLWTLNDSKRLSFPEIADWIEENVKETVENV